MPHLKEFRLTLLPRVLSLSRKVVFLVAGNAKAKMLRKILDHDPNDVAQFPCQLIRPEEKPLWLADREAASQVRQAA